MITTTCTTMCIHTGEVQAPEKITMTAKKTAAQSRAHQLPPPIKKMANTATAATASSLVILRLDACLSLSFQIILENTVLYKFLIIFILSKLAKF